MKQADWNELLRFGQIRHMSEETLNCLNGLANGRLKIISVPPPTKHSNSDQLKLLRRDFDQYRAYNEGAHSHPHVNQMFEYLLDACDSQEPWRNWQYWSDINKQWHCCNSPIRFDVSGSYRRKPAFHDFKIDDKCEFSNNGQHWSKGYFAGIDSEGRPLRFPWGTTSWIASSDSADAYTYCRKVEL